MIKSTNQIFLIDVYLDEKCPGVNEASQSDGTNAMSSDDVWEDLMLHESPLELSTALEYEPGDLIAEKNSKISVNGFENVKPAGQKCYEVDETNDDHIMDFRTGLGEHVFESPVLLEHEEMGKTVQEIFVKLQQNCEIKERGQKSQTLVETQPSRQPGKSRAETPARPKERKRKRGKAQKTVQESTKKKKAGKVVAKKAEEGLVLRRNPLRAVGAPTDYNESKNNPRGKQLSSEYIVNLLQTCNLPRRAFNKSGTLTGTSSENPVMSETLWPADTLERPTLATVAEQIPSPPSPPTWCTVTHNLLLCVLAMLARYKSGETIGFDHVSGYIIYIERLMSILTESVEETTTEEGSEEATTVMREDEVDSVTEDQVCDAVCELLANVRDVEERLRDQSAVQMIANLVDDSSLSMRKKKFQIGPVPSLEDLEALLKRAAYVYCLANRDISEEDMKGYLSCANKKKARI